jgi:hypothetical protein
VRVRAKSVRFRHLESGESGLGPGMYKHDTAVRMFFTKKAFLDG